MYMYIDVHLVQASKISVAHSVAGRGVGRARSRRRAGLADASAPSLLGQSVQEPKTLRVFVEVQK